MKPIFYKLRQPSEAKIIGVRDGLSQAEFLREGFINKSHYDEIMQHTSLKNQSNFGKFPPFEINLEYVKMRKNAKLTDFITYHPDIPFADYIVSERVVRILSTFKLPEYKLYPVIIDNQGELIDNYKLLFIIPLEEIEVCDVVKSVFFTSFFYDDKNALKFNSEREYLDYIKNDFLKTKKMVMKDNFDKNLDYFNIRGSGLFASSDLKETFEIAGVTGIKFVEANEPELVFEN